MNNIFYGFVDCMLYSKACKNSIVPRNLVSFFEESEESAENKMKEREKIELKKLINRYGKSNKINIDLKTYIEYSFSSKYLIEFKMKDNDVIVLNKKIFCNKELDKYFLLF